LSIQTLPIQIPPLSKDVVGAFENDVPLEVLLLMAGSTAMACGRGLVDDAQVITDGLTPLFSKHVFVLTLRASVALATGHQTEALQILERVMKSNPRVDPVVCMCASLRKTLGAPGWRDLAQRVIDRGEDADAVCIAEALLAEPTANLDKVAIPSVKAALASMRFT
jgi:hypothetical protein